MTLLNKVGTHNGAFHADEVFAIALLAMYTESGVKGKKFKDRFPFEIIRTRDADVLSTCDIVVDVGGVYDHSLKRYDHHQITFKDTFGSSFKTTLSSAGLIYKHYGKEVIQGVAQSHNIALKEDFVGNVHEELYKRFVEPFDGIDNGISQYPPDIKPAYSRPWTLQDQVSILNPNYTEKNINPDERFKEAVELLKDAFEKVVMNVLTGWLPSRQTLASIIQNNVAMQGSTDETLKRILVFNEPCHWKEHLSELEPTPGQYLYVIYEDETNKTWRLQAVPAETGSFESRKPLPEEWRGLRDDELDRVTGVNGGIFIHRTGFIGGHKTREGAIALARLAVLK